MVISQICWYFSVHSSNGIRSVVSEHLNKHLTQVSNIQAYCKSLSDCDQRVLLRTGTFGLVCMLLFRSLLIWVDFLRFFLYCPVIPLPVFCFVCECLLWVEWFLIFNDFISLRGLSGNLLRSVRMPLETRVRRWHTWWTRWIAVMQIRALYMLKNPSPSWTHTTSAAVSIQTFLHHKSSSVRKMKSRMKEINRLLYTCGIYDSFLQAVALLLRRRCVFVRRRDDVGCGGVVKCQ